MNSTQPITAFMAFANFLAALIAFYTLLIWIRIIISWIKTDGQTPLAHILGKIVDPYLRWFRGIKALVRPRFDLTPLVALALLSVIQSLLRLFGAHGTITVAMVIALLLQTLYNYLVHPIFLFFFILLAIRLFFCFKRSIHSITYISMLDSIIGGFLDWTQRTFFTNQVVNDRKLVIASLITLIVAWSGTSILLRFIIGFLTKSGM